MASRLPLTSTSNGVWIDGSYLIEKYQYATDRQTTGVQWLVYTVKDGELVYLKPFKTRRAAAEFIGARLMEEVEARVAA